MKYHNKQTKTAYMVWWKGKYAKKLRRIVILTEITKEG